MYGFDEVPLETGSTDPNSTQIFSKRALTSVYTIFGEVKKHWPG